VGPTSGPTGPVGQSTVLTNQSLVGGSTDLSFVAGTGDVRPPALGSDFLKEIEGLLKAWFNFSTVTTGGVFSPQTFVGSNPLSSVGHSLTQILKENQGSHGGTSTTSDHDHGHPTLPPHGRHGFNGPEQ
jgi:hypothetical protein